MAVAELKNNLIQLVLDMENPAMLTHLTDYFTMVSENGDWWEGLSTAQKDFVPRSAAQVDHGEVVPHAVVRAEINQLLEKAR